MQLCINLMVQEDLIKRLEAYSSFLEKEIKDFEEPGVNIFDDELIREVYIKTRDKLYEFIPELRPKEIR